MNAKHFAVVFKAAGVGPIEADDSILHGCGLNGFERVAVTIPVAAAFLRYHCMMLNGEWDLNAVNEIRSIYRNKVDLLIA